MAEGQVLNECGCCEGITRLTPRDLANPPGLSALVYRVGTHGSFKTSLLAGLAGPGGIPALTTRADDDPAVALLDAAATLLDVLTFYQERIANEGYLRTATERLSVLELARAIGYELKPGVAASTYLAFEMETAPGAPTSAMIPIGTKVQSLPGQDEKPQTFETTEQIQARVNWNALKPQTTQIIPPKTGATELYLLGTSTNLRPGDAVLVLGDERKGDPGSENWDMRRVVAAKTVTPGTGAAYTVVTLDQALDLKKPTLDNPRVLALRQRASLFGHNAPDWRAMSNSVKAGYLGLLETSDAVEIAKYSEWPGFTVAAIAETPTALASGTGLYGEYYDNANLTDLKLTRTDATINFAWGSGSPASQIGADMFSVRWTGAVEPKVSGVHTFFTSSDDGVRLWVNGRLLINNWTVHGVTEDSGTISLQAGRKYDIKLEFFESGGNATIALSWSAEPGLTKEIIPASQLYPRDLNALHLDAAYPQLLVGSWLVLATADAQEVYRIDATAEMARAAFLLSTKTTRLALSGENLREKFNDRLREVAILGQSEELPMAGQPVDDPVEGDTIVLDQLLSDLKAQRRLIVSGKRMRVRAQQNISLVAADGVETVPAQMGDSLLLVQTPTTLPTGAQVWTMTDKNGFTGTMTLFPGTAGSGALALIPSEPGDVAVSEMAVIKEVTANSDPTEIVLVDPLVRSYDRATVSIYANVAAATHGETRREVLGSGDAARVFQEFTLKQTPLTYISAPTASGVETTLQVRVNDVLWRETPSLYNLAARERAYITRLDDDGNVKITFGDGAGGARLPTGDENVVATYRTGIGTAGMVKAGQLSLLMTRPLGVQKVTNPLAPTGAADPEARDQARRNAPFTVLTLDRIVSLRDFEDFARAFAGIGKAQATWLWDGEQRIVHLTIAAATSNGVDYTVDPGSALFVNLRLAMDAARDTVQRLEIASYEPLFFRLKARVLVEESYITEKVLAAVKAALGQAYAFEQRSFGQPVHKSEVLGIVQAVDGVKAVFLDQLYLRGKTAELQTPLLASGAVREASVPHQGGAIKPAQLLLLDPDGVDVTEVKP